MMHQFDRFLDWYKSKTSWALGFLFITHIIQIPHMIWVGDVYLETGTIAYINPVADFIMYGIDLIEIPNIINVTFLFLAHIRKGKK